MEEYDSRRIAGGGGGKRDSDRRYRKDGEYWYAARLCDCVDFRDGVALHESQPATAFQDAVGAVDSNSGRDLERLHDAQAG